MDRLRLWAVLLGLLLAATACREEFNEHYEASALAGLNVVQVLGEYEDLSLFAQLVEDLEHAGPVAAPIEHL